MRWPGGAIAPINVQLIGGVETMPARIASRFVIMLGGVISASIATAQQPPPNPPIPPAPPPNPPTSPIRPLSPPTPPTAAVREGTIYAHHSDAQGGCPSLDWYLIVRADGVLSGLIAWDNFSGVSRAKGTIDERSRTFQIAANEVGAPDRIITVTGTIPPSGWLRGSIRGPNLNCPDMTIGSIGQPAPLAPPVVLAPPANPPSPAPVRQP